MTGSLNITGTGSTFTVADTANLNSTVNIADDLDVDSGVLFVDTSANEVGINAGVNPLSTLHVVGDSGILIQTVTNQGNAKIKFSDTAPGVPTQTGTISYNHGDGNSPNSEYNETFTMQGDQTNLAFRVVGDIIASKKIGVNINRQPDYTLEVDGTGMFNGGVYIDNANDNGGAPIYFLGSNTQKNFRIGNQEGFSNAFEITPSTNNGGQSWSTTPGLLVHGDSRVSINTDATSGTDPETSTVRNYRLNVQGDVNFNGQLFQNNAEFVTSRWTEATNQTDIYRLSKVGINTADPTNQLAITGDVNIIPGTFASGQNPNVLKANNSKLYVDSNGIFRRHNRTISENVTVANNDNCFSAGEVTIQNGTTVTVAAGGSWSVV